MEEEKDATRCLQGVCACVCVCVVSYAVYDALRSLDTITIKCRIYHRETHTEYTHRWRDHAPGNSVTDPTTATRHWNDSSPRAQPNVCV